ncbi:MAG: hypothetical protein HY240_06095 [Actinobacteria bacterium]|nr:hypothetical protein [Actinomycetota bacterium]
MPGRDPGEAWRGADAAWGVTGTLLAGIVVWGGAGYVADRLLGLQGLFLPIGMLIGMGTSIFIVYLRHGRSD